MLVLGVSRAPGTPGPVNAGIAGGLPGRANATIRSPAAAGSVRQVQRRLGINVPQRIDSPGLFV
jgi:hypothetical protein